MLFKYASVFIYAVGGGIALVAEYLSIRAMLLDEPWGTWLVFIILGSLLALFGAVMYAWEDGEEEEVVKYTTKYKNKYTKRRLSH